MQEIQKGAGWGQKYFLQHSQ